MDLWPIHLNDIPFIVFVVLGIFLPEWYSRWHLDYRPLVTLRLITLFSACALAAIVNHALYPLIDSGTSFTRAFVEVGFSRLVIITSHQMAEQNKQTKALAKAEAHNEQTKTHTTVPLQETPE